MTHDIAKIDNIPYINGWVINAYFNFTEKQTLALYGLQGIDRHVQVLHLLIF